MGRACSILALQPSGVLQAQQPRRRRHRRHRRQHWRRRQHRRQQEQKQALFSGCAVFGPPSLALKRPASREFPFVKYSVCQL